MKRFILTTVFVLMGIYYFSYLIFGSLLSSSFELILAPIGIGFAVFILFVSSLKSKGQYPSHIIWLVNSFACLSWFAANLIMEASGMDIAMDPSGHTLIVYLKASTNILFTAGLAVYAIHHSKWWNTSKLLLDTVMLGIASLAMAWILVFDRDFALVGILIQHGFLSLLTIFSDISVILGSAIWYMSVPLDKNPAVIRFMSGGIVLFSLIDLYNRYIQYHGIHVNTGVVDLFYMGAFMLMAIGGLFNLYNLKETTITPPGLNTNLNSAPKELILLVCPILAMAIKGFYLPDFIIFLGLVVLYKGLNTNLMAAIKNEQLLHKEKELNGKLEDIIASHTKQLMEANEELSRKNESLQFLSNKDTLTNLYNRRYILDQLKKNISFLPENHVITLMYIDLDRFKVINDTYGHDMGDRILIETSRRLMECAPKNAVVARMGGDEFVCSYISTFDSMDAPRVATEIIQACNRNICIDGYVFCPALCIGISIYPLDAMDVVTLMKNADIALYQAKSKGINNFADFSMMSHDTTEKNNRIEILLNKADINTDFELYYQPLYRISDRSLIGAEALIRWHNPKHGLISPDEFIHIAEQTGHVNKIGSWVIRNAVAQAIKWNHRYKDNLKIGINISPRQLNSVELLAELQSLIQNKKFNPSWLDIEITESVAMEGEYRMSQIFNLFKSIGMSVSIDDFGTGYSSIAYLKRYSFDRIKIAKPLIDSIATSWRDREIVQAIVVLAKTIGIETIAEGVETNDQLQILSELGCDHVQGFLLVLPVPAKEFEFLIKHNAHIQQSYEPCNALPVMAQG